MKRYSLRSCKPKPSMESSSDRFMRLGDNLFPVTTDRSSLEANMGMSTRVMVSVIVGLLVGIITKFFTSSDDGSASLQNSINEYNDAIDKYKNDVIISDVTNSATWNNIVDDIVDDMWQKQHVQSFIKSNAYSVVVNDAGHASRELSALTSVLCAQTADLAMDLASSARRDQGATAKENMDAFNNRLIERAYPKLKNICRAVGIDVGPHKGIAELLSTLTEVLGALRQENSAITDQQAQKKLTIYVNSNQSFNMDSMILNFVDDDVNKADEYLTKAKTELAKLESFLEKRGDSDETEFTSAVQELGKLTSICGKFLGLVNSVVKSTKKLSDAYVSSMKKFNAKDD